MDGWVDGLGSGRGNGEEKGASEQFLAGKGGVKR